MTAFFVMKLQNLLDFAFVVLFVAVLEFIHAPGSVHKLHLTSVKWVRSVRNFQLNERVFLTILPHDGLLRLHGGAGEKAVIVGHILEHNEAVIFRMNVFFHGSQDFSDLGLQN